VGLLDFLTPPLAGADLRAALVASCWRGALPPVLLRAVWVGSDAWATTRKEKCEGVGDAIRARKPSQLTRAHTHTHTRAHTHTHTRRPASFAPS
jgi:hypothetical protein